MEDWDSKIHFALFCCSSDMNFSYMLIEHFVTWLFMQRGACVFVAQQGSST
jgi:hypothetical protein